jgi:hypothetical protein
VRAIATANAPADVNRLRILVPLTSALITCGAFREEV